MKPLFAMSLVVILSISPAFAGKQKPESGNSDVQEPSVKAVCESLSTELDYGNKQIAMSKSEGFGDNSAPRATMRKMDINNQLQINSMTLMLMIQQKCTMPKSADTSVYYFTEAMKCGTARIRGSADAPECDMSKWKGWAEKSEK